MLNLGSTNIGTSDIKKLVAFYKEVFGKKPDMEEGTWAGWLVGKTFFSILEHSEVKGKSKEGPRIMFNFETKDVKKEAARIKKIGAEVIAEPYEMQGAWIATFADPDGNYFQLMTPWEDMK